MNSVTRLFTRRTGKYVVVGIVLILSVAGMATRLYLAGSSKQKLAEAYPRLEALLAIYSVLGWRSSGQLPPDVTEKSETTGSELTLNCPRIPWGAGGVDRTDSLFSCFAEPRTVYIPEEGEEIQTTQLIPAEEYSYDFAWDSVFGYELKVRLQGYEAFEKESPIARERAACLEELQDDESGHATCRFNMYRVTLTGLTAGESVTFITADGRLSWNPDGSVQRREERIVYLDQDTPITVGEIDAVIQKMFRAFGIAEQDIAKTAPQLEVLWMSKDDAFLRALMAEIDKAPDLIRLSEYLQGK